MNAKGMTCIHYMSDMNLWEDCLIFVPTSFEATAVQAVRRGAEMFNEETNQEPYGQCIELALANAGVPYLIEYCEYDEESDISELKVLFLNKDGFNILNWLAILLNNRTFSKRSPIARQAEEYILKEFLPDISGYDVIWGYRADDSYFSYAKDFLNNSITVSQLVQAMKLGELGEQIVLISPKAFENIRFLGYEIADGSVYGPRRAERETRARRAYLDTHGNAFSVGKNELFVRDIISEQVKNNDPRLR